MLKDPSPQIMTPNETQIYGRYIIVKIKNVRDEKNCLKQPEKEDRLSTEKGQLSVSS